MTLVADRIERIACRIRQAKVEQYTIRHQSIKVLYNPTHKQIYSLLLKHNNLRWAEVDDELYVWNSHDATHKSLVIKIFGPDMWKSRKLKYGYIYVEDGVFTIAGDYSSIKINKMVDLYHGRLASRGYQE